MRLMGGLACFLVLAVISFAVWASANTVSSKLIRRLDAISLLAIAQAVAGLDRAECAALDARNLHVTGDRIARHPSRADSAAFSTTSDDASYMVAVNAAAFDDATPLSAWQPPSAADSVGWCLQR